MQKTKLSIKHLLSFKRELLCRIQISPPHAEFWYLNLRGRTCPDIEFRTVRELIPFAIHVWATTKLGHVINLPFLIYRLKRTILGQFFVLIPSPHLHHSNLLRLPLWTGELPDFWLGVSWSYWAASSSTHLPLSKGLLKTLKLLSTWANSEGPSALLWSRPLHGGRHSPQKSLAQAKKWAWAKNSLTFKHLCWWGQY